MSGDALDNTEEELGAVVYRLEDAIKETLNIVKPIAAGFNGLVSDIAELKLLQAAKEIPATITAVSEQGGEAIGAAGKTAGAAVGTVPAVATDVLEDVEKVGSTTGKAAERAEASIWRQKIRRK
jgi:hypothetical protein